MTRRKRQLATAMMVLIGTTGCVMPWFKKDERTELQKKGDEIREVMESEERPHIIGEIAVARGLHLAKVQGVGLVANLPNTGGDPRPSEQRTTLLQEIRTHEIPKSDELIASPTTALVMVSAWVPPAIQKDERIDLVIKTSEISDAKSLQSGQLLPTRLREFRTLGGTLRQSDVFGLGAGSLVTESDATLKVESLKQLRGVIPGGGRMTVSRGLSLLINDDFSHVFTAAAVSKSINERFFRYDGSTRRGAAVPKRDQMIEIGLDPKYRLDPQHYMNVIMSLGFSEKASDKAARLELCRRQLQEPTTARRASLQLEAIGKEGIPALVEGMISGNDEIRFYCSHALAYLNDRRCVDTLEQLTITQPAFRAMTLNGLTILDHFEAQEALIRLMQVPDPEVRYGALCALRERDPREPSIRGIQMGEVTRVVQIPTKDTPVIAFSLSKFPEIAIFGDDPPLRISTFIRVNSRILLRPDPSGELRISRFEPGAADRIQLVPMSLTGMIHGLVEVGATYGDVMLAIMAASAENAIPYPVVVNPRPVAGRTFNRNQPAAASPWELAPNGGADDLPIEEIEIVDENEEANESGTSEEIEAEEAEVLEVKAHPWWDIRSWTSWGSSKETETNSDKEPSTLR
jgi:hypothetical protein